VARLFITQERIEAWTAERKISVAGDVLTLAADGRAFRIRPATRFLRVAGGDGDPNQLVDTVQDEQQLEGMGADSYMSSCIVGDTAYDVQAGFLGEPLAGG
jgi:hypothetical protein